MMHAPSCARSLQVEAMRLRLLILTLLFFLPMRASASPAQQETVQTTWRLLDYVAVDYAGAVRNGAVTSPSEYAEMREFTATAQRQIAALPPSAARSSLLIQGHALQQAVASKSSPEVIAAQAHKLGADLLKAYPVPLAPPSIPDLRRGEALFQTNCATCHGANGTGDGPAAASLNPRPVNFTDRDRAAKRSTFALEQVIDQGLDGMAMASFARLPVQDRWDLAFRSEPSPTQRRMQRRARRSGTRTWLFARRSPILRLLPQSHRRPSQRT